MSNCITRYFWQFSVILSIALNGCIHKGYADVYDKGEWMPLDNIDGEGCYVKYNDSIYGLEIFNYEFCKYYNALPEVDVKTFKVCKGSGYAKDCKNVYYPLCMECEDRSDFPGACYVTEYIIKEADPESFKYLGDGYAVDKRNMYYEGKKVPWNDDVIKKAKRWQ